MGSFCWTMLNLSCLDQAAEEAVKQSPAEWPWGFRIAVWVGRFSDWVSLFFPPSQPPSSYNLKPFPPSFSVGKRDMPSAAAVPHCAGGTSLGCGTAVWDDQPHPPPLCQGEVALHPTDEWWSSWTARAVSHLVGEVSKLLGRTCLYPSALPRLRSGCMYLQVGAQFALAVSDESHNVSCRLVFLPLSCPLLVLQMGKV